MKKDLGTKVKEKLGKFTGEVEIDKIMDFIDALANDYLAFKRGSFLYFTMKNDARIFCYEIISFISTIKQKDIDLYLRNKSIFDNLLQFVRCNKAGSREGLSFDNGYHQMLLSNTKVYITKNTEKIKDISSKTLCLEECIKEDCDSKESSEIFVISTFLDIEKHIEEPENYQAFVLEKDGVTTLHSTVKSAITLAFTEPIAVSQVDGIIDIKYLVNLGSYAKIYPINLDKWEDKLYELYDMTKENVQDCIIPFSQQIVK